jgi:hypothetical protein
MSNKNPLERSFGTFEENYGDEFRKSLREMGKIRRLAYHASKYTLLVAPLVGTLAGYELSDSLRSPEFPEYHNYIMGFGCAWLGLAAGWFGGLCLTHWFSDLLNPKGKELWKKFQQEHPREFEMGANEFRIFKRDSNGGRKW